MVARFENGYWKWLFWSQIRSRVGELDATPPLKMPWDTPSPTTLGSITAVSQTAVLLSFFLQWLREWKCTVFVKCAKCSCLFISDQESPIVNVLSRTENPSLVFIVHQNSITQCWEFTQSNYKWIKRNEFQLSNTKRVEVLDVILHPLVSSFIWCERRSVSASNSITCCVCLREVTVSERLGNNIAVSVGPLVVILHGSPAMSLHVIGRGVCMMPGFPEELRNIILFWAFVQRTLKVGQTYLLRSDIVPNQCYIESLQSWIFEFVIND